MVKATFFDDFDPALLLALVNTSNHPISKGIAQYLHTEYETLKEIPLEQIKSIEAKGIEAQYQRTNTY